MLMKCVAVLGAIAYLVSSVFVIGQKFGLIEEGVFGRLFRSSRDPPPKTQSGKSQPAPKSGPLQDPFSVSE